MKDVRPSVLWYTFRPRKKSLHIPTLKFGSTKQLIPDLASDTVGYHPRPLSTPTQNLSLSTRQALSRYAYAEICAVLSVYDLVWFLRE